MTLLSNREIEAAVRKGDIVIDPFIPELVKRNSYLLRLGERFRRIDARGIVDTADPASMSQHEGVEFEDDSVVVTHRSLIIASSLETIAVAPDLVGILSGISNVARLGVVVHAASEFVNAGYGREAASRVVFELATVGGREVRLWRGTPVCHLAFVRMKQPADYPETSARTGQDGPGASRLFSQFGRYIERRP